jgi:hypothetical protein
MPLPLTRRISALSQSRRFGDVCRMSGLPQIVLQNSQMRSAGAIIEFDTMVLRSMLCLCFILINIARQASIVLQHNPQTTDIFDSRRFAFGPERSAR